MTKLPAVALAVLTLIAVSGCESWSDYPHNEPCLKQSDLQKSGPGPYGGESTPASPATQKSDAGKL
jgi:hypothetical protein